LSSRARAYFEEVPTAPAARDLDRGARATSETVHAPARRSESYARRRGGGGEGGGGGADVGDVGDGGDGGGNGGGGGGGDGGGGRKETLEEDADSKCDALSAPLCKRRVEKRGREHDGNRWQAQRQR
jgi:hypothetical protein